MKDKNVQRNSRIAHIDALAAKYIGQDRYPWRRPGEVHVTVKIVAEHVHGMG